MQTIVRRGARKGAHVLGNLALSVRWALRLRDGCERWRATGRVLDGQALGRIAGDVERRMGAAR